MTSNEPHPLDLVPDLRISTEVFDLGLQFIAEGDSILDLGCGLGFLLERLSALRNSYRGIDLSPDVIRFCRSRFGTRPGIQFDVADASSLDIPSPSYDVVAVLNLLHLPGADPVSVLRKTRQALKSGGRLIVSGPSRGSGPDAGPGYYCNAEGMEALLKYLGFNQTLVARSDLCHGRAYLVVTRI